jgi:protein-disulfide isomerase
MKKQTLFVVAAAGLLLAFIVGRSLYNQSQEREAASAAEATRAILERPHAPSFGHPDAPVVIVEFIDPACETCAAFYPMVKQLMAEHAGRIRLVLRWAPFHRGVDQVVAALEATRRQDKLWPALEALLQTQPRWAPNHTADLTLAWPYLEGLGLDLTRVRADMTSPDVARAMNQDLADLRVLNVTMTPAYFVNGTPLVDFGWAPLRQLVENALRESERR